LKTAPVGARLSGVNQGVILKRRLALLLTVAVTAVGAASAAAPAVSTTAPLAATKTCSAGYVHAVLSWGHKCLRRGQFCKVSGEREYHRYGFHCHTGRLR
jgi:hypothetical protein